MVSRSPRLAELVHRVADVVHIHAAGEAGWDLDHLDDAFVAALRWGEAWEQFEAPTPPPHDDVEYASRRGSGSRPDDFAIGMSDLLVMSSGHVTSLRPSPLGSVQVPLKVSHLISHLISLDTQGQRLLADSFPGDQRSVIVELTTTH